MPSLDPQVRKLELSLEGLLKLLGGTPSQRERFWEILKGITTPAEFRLAATALTAAEQQVKAAQNTLAGVQRAAGQVRR
jgi:hypothetical protein